MMLFVLGIGSLIGGVEKELMTAVMSGDFLKAEKWIDVYYLKKLF